MRFLFFAFYIIFIGYIESTTFNKCSQRMKAPLDVRIRGCTTNCPTCDVMNETNITVEIDFITPEDFSNGEVIASIYEDIGEDSLYYTLDRSKKICDSIKNNVTCPLTKDQKVTYETQYHLQAYFESSIYHLIKYSKMQAFLKIVIVNYQSRIVFCTNIPITLHNFDETCYAYKIFG